MLGDFFKALTGKSEGNETRIWKCNPLVVIHVEDGVVYSQETDVEFTPDSSEEKTGHAVAVEPTADGWRPEITVARRRESSLTKQDPHIRTRGGMSLEGVDSEGIEFTWLINEMADRYFVPSMSKGRSENATAKPTSVDRPKPQPALADRLNQEPIDAQYTQEWLCEPLLTVGQAGEMEVYDEVTIEFTPMESPERRGFAHLPAQGEAAPDSKLHVLAIEEKKWGRRGHKLTGLTPAGENVIWYTSGSADEVLGTSGPELGPEPPTMFS